MTKPSMKKKRVPLAALVDYSGLLGGLSELLEAARRASARAVNALMTATYWEVGRRIVEFEQHGEKRAGYGEEVLKRLALDLTARFGRGFSRQNLHNMRQFYLSAPPERIRQIVSGEFAVEEKRAIPTLESTGSTIFQTPAVIFQTPTEKSPALPFNLSDLARAFPLPWSHYVLLISRARSPDRFRLAASCCWKPAARHGFKSGRSKGSPLRRA